MLTIDNTVLLLIDVQGKLARIMYESDKLFAGLETMVKAMKILDVPVIWMEQVPESIGPTIDRLAELLPDLKPIAKNTFSCCSNQEFMDRFDALGRSKVLLTGIETHICVYQTGIDLIKAGYEVQAVADCVSSRTKENKEIGLDRIRQAGGYVTSNEMVFFELMKAAKGDNFKQIVKLIK
jgi:nicotinamidase-related amidase